MTMVARPFVFSCVLLLLACAGTGCGTGKKRQEAENLRQELGQIAIEEAKARFFVADEYRGFVELRQRAEQAYEAEDYRAAVRDYDQALKGLQDLAARLDRLAWTCSLGGDKTDYGSAVRQTADGGYVVVGATRSLGAGQVDVYLAKVSPLGAKEWERTFGGENDDIGYSVRVVPDGGFIIAGRTGSFGDWAGDVYVLKTDAQGNEVWHRTYGGGGTDVAEDVRSTADGGYIAAGATFLGGPGKKVYLIKLDAQGNEAWHQTLGGKEDAWARAVGQTADGGYVVAGGIGSINENRADFLLVKTDGQGAEQWRARFEGGAQTNLGALDAQQCSDGGYILVGETASTGAHQGDVYLCRIDGAGALLWERTFGGAQHETPWSVHQTVDGGFVIAGLTRSFGAGGTDIYVIKTDAEGQQKWARTLGSAGDDEAQSIELTTDGGFVIAGRRQEPGAQYPDLYLVKMDSRGYAWSEGAQLGSDELVPVPAPPVPGVMGPPPAPVVADRGPKIGDVAPEIAAKEWLNTDTALNLGALRGKLVVLVFWATWCGAEDESFAALNTLYTNYRDRGVVVIGLTDEDRQDARVDEFVAQARIVYPVGTGASCADAYGVRGVPDAFLLSPEGKVLWRGHPTIGLEKAVKDNLRNEEGGDQPGVAGLVSA